MPTKNPRLMVTLQPRTSAQLRRISELTNSSQSSLVATLLETQAEVFDRMIRLLAAADVVKDELRGKSLAEDLHAAQSKVESQLGLALAEFDGVNDDLVSVAERVRHRAKGAGGSTRRVPALRVAAVLTPPSNRGVRSTNKSAAPSHQKGKGHGPL